MQITGRCPRLTRIRRRTTMGYDRQRACGEHDTARRGGLSFAGDAYWPQTMSSQISPLLTPENLGFLLSGHAGAVTVGGIMWERDRIPRIGTVTVATSLAPCRLRMVINVLAPSEPRLQYLVLAGRNGFAARRLCVNVPHRPFPGTHKHRARPGGGDESTYRPDDIPEVPLQPRVAPGTYRAVLEAFAAECAITLGPDFDWTEP